MRISTIALIVPVMAGMLILAGCQGATDPGISAIPIGLYANTVHTTEAGVETRRVRSILLPSQLEGHIYDTLYTLRGGTWVADSIAETELHFQIVGDGYQRTVEVYHNGDAPVDSSIAYWYFFRRSDSLYYYTGQRFLGTNAGLAGSWESDPRDTAFTHRYYALRFHADSVSVTYRAHSTGDLTGMYPYTADRNTLAIQGLSLNLGERYEVVPGWSLYLTTLATQGYKSQL